MGIFDALSPDTSNPSPDQVKRMQDLGYSLQTATPISGMAGSRGAIGHMLTILGGQMYTNNAQKLQNVIGNNKRQVLGDVAASDLAAQSGSPNPAATDVGDSGNLERTTGNVDTGNSKDQWINRLIQIESGGDPGNVTGSNRGLGQFGPAEEKKYGITSANWKNPDVQRAALAKEYDEFTTAFKSKMGRDPSPGELYIMHQQGLSGGLAHISNPNNSSVANIQQFYKSNPALALAAIHGNIDDKSPLKSMDPRQVTSGQFTDYWKNKFESKLPKTQVASNPPNGMSFDPVKDIPRIMTLGGPVPAAVPGEMIPPQDNPGNAAPGPSPVAASAPPAAAAPQVAAAPGLTPASAPMAPAAPAQQGVTAAPPQGGVTIPGQFGNILPSKGASQTMSLAQLRDFMGSNAISDEMKQKVLDDLHGRTVPGEPVQVGANRVQTASQNIPAATLQGAPIQIANSASANGVSASGTSVHLPQANGGISPDIAGGSISAANNLKQVVKPLSEAAAQAEGLKRDFTTLEGARDSGAHAADEVNKMRNLSAIANSDAFKQIQKGVYSTGSQEAIKTLQSLGVPVGSNGQVAISDLLATLQVPADQIGQHTTTKNMETLMKTNPNLMMSDAGFKAVVDYRLQIAERQLLLSKLAEGHRGDAEGFRRSVTDLIQNHPIVPKIGGRSIDDILKGEEQARQPSNTADKYQKYNIRPVQ